jgi:uncharacterized protein (TIGR02246 family)
MLKVVLLTAVLFVMPASAADGDDDAVAVRAVLDIYKRALEQRDLTGVERLFAQENEVVESGKVEGSYADYRDHHIGPELGHFESFSFSDYRVTLRIEGDVALATETYRYTIRLIGKADPIERQGVATSVLKKIDGGWRIVSMHSSSRAPKPKSAAP